MDVMIRLGDFERESGTVVIVKCSVCRKIHDKKSSISHHYVCSAANILVNFICIYKAVFNTLWRIAPVCDETLWWNILWVCIRTSLQKVLRHISHVSCKVCSLRRIHGQRSWGVCSIALWWQVLSIDWNEFVSYSWTTVMFLRIVPRRTRLFLPIRSRAT